MRGDIDGKQQTLEVMPAQARRTANAAQLGFQTTAELPDPQRIMGQQRGEEAIEFALQMPDGQYNLYVSGLPGSGRTTTTLRAVERAAKQQPPGEDWCYVHHFDRPGEPLAISLPAGQGRVFARDVDGLVTAAGRQLRRAFQSEAVRAQRESVLRDLASRHAHVIAQLQREAVAHGFLVEETPVGLATVPLKRTGADPGSRGANGDHGVISQGAAFEPMVPQEFAALSPDERARLSAEQQVVGAQVEHALPELRALEDEARERLATLRHEVAQAVVAPLVDTLVQRYAQFPRVVDYLHHMESDIVAHADVLIVGDEQTTPASLAAAGQQRDTNAPTDDDRAQDESSAPLFDESTLLLDEALQERPAVAVLLRRYRVNVVVTRTPDERAPIVQEINPAYHNLVGRLEFGLEQGLPYTDHLLIKPGALHRANGGYLILHAKDLLEQPLAWDALKRVLRFGVIGFDGSDGMQVVPASASLRPEPIPARVKVILIGDPAVGAILAALDPEFTELFKVRADFATDMDRTPETERFYAELAGYAARAAHCSPLTSDAVARLIEEGSRWAEDQERLSAQLQRVQDLVAEAGRVAAGEGAPATTRAHMAHALEARVRRVSLVPDKLDSLIQQQTILIDTAGWVEGQVNGLTVMASLDYAFGKPARITARTSPGMAGIVNLERETMTSGPAHTKGILILSGFLAGRYAQEFPLSLSGSICFEQVYGEVEGDSASSAELYALLSSLAHLPIRQSLAVTGSVNQRGEVQAVGGINEKIEGFFQLCKSRGLTGEQGVVMPRANLRNLMLREDVVAAMRQGQFHIFAVNTIDEGIELLTGVTADAARPDGSFPEDSVNGRVSRTLRTFAEKVRSQAALPVLSGRPM